MLSNFFRYVSEESHHGRIPNWSFHGQNPKPKSPQTLLLVLIDKICKDTQVSIKMRKILLYIWYQIELSNGKKGGGPPTNQDNDLELLLWSIAPVKFNPSIYQLGSQLENIMADNEWIKEILTGINRYIYRHPREQILAFLTKLQTKLTDDNADIERIVSSLLANLIFTKGISSGNILVPFWMVVDVIDEPGGNSTIREIMSFLINEMFKEVVLWNGLPGVINVGGDHCGYPKECVLHLLEKMHRQWVWEGVDYKLSIPLGTLINATRQDFQKNQETNILVPPS